MEPACYVTSVPSLGSCEDSVPQTGRCSPWPLTTSDALWSPSPRPAGPARGPSVLCHLPDLL